MRTTLLLAVWAILQSFLPCRTQNTVLGPAFFAEKRAKLGELLPKGGVAVFFAGAPGETGWWGSGEVGAFQPQPGFYRLTGMEMPGAVLVIADSALTFRGESLNEFLFVPRTSHRHDEPGRFLDGSVEGLPAPSEGIFFIDLWNSFCQDVLGSAQVSQVHVPFYTGSAWGHPISGLYSKQVLQLNQAVGPGYAPAHFHIFEMLERVQKGSQGWEEAREWVQGEFQHQAYLASDPILLALSNMQGPVEYEEIRSNLKRLKIAQSPEAERQILALLNGVEAKELSLLQEEMKGLEEGIKKGIGLLQAGGSTRSVESGMELALVHAGLNSYPGAEAFTEKRYVPYQYIWKNQPVEAEQWVSLRAGALYNGLNLEVGRSIPPKNWEQHAFRKAYDLLRQVHGELLEYLRAGEEIALLEDEFARRLGARMEQAHPEWKKDKSYTALPLVSIQGALPQTEGEEPLILQKGQLLVVKCRLRIYRENSSKRGLFELFIIDTVELGADRPRVLSSGLSMDPAVLSGLRP